MNIGMNIQNNSYLLIDRGALLCNANTILQSLEQGTQLVPVLKDDAYGLGLVQVARTLCELEEIRLFAVAHVSEGLTLRKAGIDREVLVMGGALPFQLEEAVSADLTIACAHLGFASQIAATAARLGRRAKIQIKIDTGLHRIGLEFGELDVFLDELRSCRESVLVTGVFSHFSDVRDAQLDHQEFKSFLNAIDVLKAGGVVIPMCHIACSAALELHPEYCMDAVRCGRRLYMDSPERPDGRIREVASWRSYITQVKCRAAGETLGYGGKVRLEKDTLVATVGVGYGDGLNQALFSIGAPVLIGGRRCRMLACCMDQCMIDVSGLDCKVGDEVTFFGRDAEGNFLSSQEIASLIGGDEGCGLTSALSGRVARVYC